MNLVVTNDGIAMFLKSARSLEAPLEAQRGRFSYTSENLLKTEIFPGTSLRSVEFSRYS